MKRILLIFFIAAMLLTIASCGRQTLDVVSVDYPEITKLTAAEPDLDRIRNWYYSSNPYWDNYCELTLTKNGDLALSRDDDNYRVSVFYGTDRYFIGTHMGSHYDGWVLMFPFYYSLRFDDEFREEANAPMPDEAVPIAPEYCLGFIEIDREHCYLITNEMDDDTYSRVYNIYRDADTGEWHWDIIGELAKKVSCYCFDKEEKIIYFVSREHILSFDVDACEYTEIADRADWLYSVNSIVKQGSKLYLCMNMGIYEYDLETDESLWYPIPHEKYGNKEEQAEYKEHYDCVKKYGIAPPPKPLKKQDTTN